MTTIAIVVGLLVLGGGLLFIRWRRNEEAKDAARFRRSAQAAVTRRRD